MNLKGHVVTTKYMSPIFSKLNIWNWGNYLGEKRPCTRHFRFLKPVPVKSVIKTYKSKSECI